MRGQMRCSVAVSSRVINRPVKRSIACLDLSQRGYCRSIKGSAVDRELRAVTGAIPAGFERVPVQMTADVRACGRSGVQGVILVAIGRDLGQALSYDRALAGLELVQR